MLRAFTVLGRSERALKLFKEIHRKFYHLLTTITLSNMFFTSLGSEELDQNYFDQLISDFQRLSLQEFDSSSFSTAQTKQRLEVSERPILAVMSADLRNHPVGRFWLPLARTLRNNFRIFHFTFNPTDHDWIRDELKSHSEEWHPIDKEDNPIPLLNKTCPHILLDLGGHTADNRPGVLNYRIAKVQATYLGFYGPTYASECDWWILDKPVASRVRNSYPGSEPIWELPGPSLCFDPSIHGAPNLDGLKYKESNHLVFGLERGKMT